MAVDPATLALAAKYAPMILGSIGAGGKNEGRGAQGMMGIGQMVSAHFGRKEAERATPPATDPFTTAAMTRLNRRIRALDVGTDRPTVTNRTAVRSGRALASAINRDVMAQGRVAEAITRGNQQTAMQLEGLRVNLNQYQANRSLQLALLDSSRLSARAESDMQAGQMNLMDAVADKVGKQAVKRATSSIPQTTSSAEIELEGTDN